MTMPNTTANPAEDSSGHYLGEAGQQYFERQNAGGVAAALYNRFLYIPYVCGEDDILDFGCGGGHLLASLPAKSRTGIDINPAARAVAVQQGLEVYAHLEELADRRFSRIITSHALEHVPSPLDTLTQLRRLLQPDGLLVWLSPMDDWRTKRQRVARSNDFDMHMYTWTPLTLGNLLITAGFRLNSVRIVTHAIPPVIHARLWRLSPALFHRAAWLWASMVKRRQILAVAAPAAELRNPEMRTTRSP